MTDAPANPMLPRPFRIDAVRRESIDTFTLTLRPQTGAAPFAFAAGQFNMLYVFGVGEVPVSISGDPGETSALIHTVRAVGTVTDAIKSCKRGSVLGVRGPFGTHWPLERALGRDVVIVAGGLGLAPLRPVLYRLIAERDKFGAVTLLCGAREPDALIFWRELDQWRKKIDVQITVDRADTTWRSAVGWITTLVPNARFNPENAAAYLCGPEIMMRSTARELLKRGLRDESIYVSLERNMKCAIGLCGHCMFGPTFICKDGPVFPYSRVKDLMLIREL